MQQLLALSGSARQIGFAQGSDFRADLPSALIAVRAGLRLPKWAPLAALRLALRQMGGVYARRFGSAWRTYRDGYFWQVLEGIADGLGEPLNLVIGLGSAEVFGANFGYTLGCTSLAVQGDSPFIAYNHDFPPSLGAFARCRRRQPSAGFASLSLGYSIMPGAIAGLNEAGLACSLNHAYAIDRHRRPSMLASMLVQDCLDRARTVKEAIAILTSAVVPNGSLVTLVDANERAVVELSCGQHAVRTTRAPLLHSFNRYQCEVTRAVEIPVDARGTGLARGAVVHAANLSRQARWETLSLPARPSVDAMWKILSDHGGGATGHAGTICRHDDPLSETLLGAIIDPREQRIEVRFGHPCEQPSEIFHLRDARREAA